ncbi:MAG: YicC/YloC family endoribonuclease, partial [Desulfosalsimonas sp.]
MTAFAGAEKSGEGISTAIEIRGVNSRYLDIAIRMPPSYTGLEDLIKQNVSRKVFRGRIEIRVTIREADT